MNIGIILLIVFLIIVYIFLFIKIKKNKEKTKNIDSIRDFNSSYQHLASRQNPTNRQKFQTDKNNPYNNYVTKYNSSEDYREKR